MHIPKFSSLARSALGHTYLKCTPTHQSRYIYSIYINLSSQNQLRKQDKETCINLSFSLSAEVYLSKCGASYSARLNAVHLASTPRRWLLENTDISDAHKFTPIVVVIPKTDTYTEKRPGSGTYSLIFHLCTYIHSHTRMMIKCVHTINILFEYLQVGLMWYEEFSPGRQPQILTNTHTY